MCIGSRTGKAAEAAGAEGVYEYILKPEENIPEATEKLIKKGPPMCFGGEGSEG